jgi:hypothetical protein
MRAAMKHSINLIKFVPAGEASASPNVIDDATSLRRLPEETHKKDWLVVNHEEHIDSLQIVLTYVKLSRRQETTHHIKLLSIDTIPCWFGPLLWNESKETYQEFSDRMKKVLITNDQSWTVLEENVSPLIAEWNWVVSINPDGFGG